MADGQTTPLSELTRLSDRMGRTSPFGQFEIKTLTMAATANVDTAITHNLKPILPTDVGYIIIQQNAAGDVYHDLSVGHREWTSSTIYLRSTIAALRVSILLFVPNKSLAATTLTGTTTGSPPWSTVTSAVTANYIFAGPTTGAAAVPTFRTMVVADVPTLNQNTTGYAGGLAITSQAIYDTYYALSATTTGRIANGTTGQVYTATTGAAPSWASPAVATSLTVADTTSVSCYVALWEGATGAQAAKSDAGLTYNAGTGVLTATGFSGPLTGNVTGNASGTADTVTNATQGSITSIANLATVGTITSGVWNAGSVTSSSSVSDSVGSMATIRAGGIGIASQTALDLITAGSTTQLARTAAGTALQVPRINSTGTGWEFAAPADATARAGGIAITSQAALDFIYAGTTSQLARLAAGSALQVPRINAAGNGWEFASMGLKAIRRGTITVSSGTASNTATITAVDVDKSYVNNLGYVWTDSAEHGGVRLVLTNTTTVTALTNNITGPNVTIGFEVVEFY
jgi:hypothetical protein